MRFSEDRILTTHTGSLPRKQELTHLLVRREQKKEFDKKILRDLIKQAVNYVVAKQLESRIDIGNDGEQPRVSFTTYVEERMTGFGGESNVNLPADLDAFPKYAERLLADSWNPTEAAKVVNAPQAVGEVKYDEDMADLKHELSVFSESLDRQKKAGRFVEPFMTASSPGSVATVMLRTEDNPFYASDEEYVMAVASELKKEYEQIVANGFVLQVDAPDLAMERQIMFKNRPLDEFLERVKVHIESINLAVQDIPPDRVRLHVCWGNWDGGHVHDVDLEPLLPLLYKAKAGALSLALANPRHQHEYKVLKKNPLPDSMILIPGVIDVTTNYVEHPEVVADRICQAVDVMGDRSRVIAGCDCGFGTFAGCNFVAEDICWAKLSSLRAGADIASGRLWG